MSDSQADATKALDDKNNNKSVDSTEAKQKQEMKIQTDQSMRQ